jgi:hypothetical protein
MLDLICSLDLAVCNHDDPGSGLLQLRQAATAKEFLLAGYASRKRDARRTREHRRCGGEHKRPRARWGCRF